jgi:hypothetical protein
MIIVAGRIYVHPGRREAFIAASLPSVEPIDVDRVNVYEAWDSEADLEAFRGKGPGDDLSADIVSADVQRYYVERSGPA